MQIARLEIFGFKSFPERTTFRFGAGISCVVGPNGSGKSNVVDALRWCIGEQSARSLRGSEMTDVIFAGSTDRKAVGFADVQLTIETGRDAPFPGDYAAMAQIVVGRRLHRNGTSEYFVNQVKVRRRDVVELLLDSGIGNNLYSFIEQGQVDKMIVATPEERRSVIDEAAGIARYKARRDEAQHRLVATATQLDRAADVVDEMGRRLRTLERQVVAAARFRELRTRIRNDEILLFLAKHQALSADRRALRDVQHAARTAEETARREVLRRETDLEERRAEIEQLETAGAASRDRLAEIDGGIAAEHARIGVQRERVEELSTQMSQARLESTTEEARGVEAGAEVQRRVDESAAAKTEIASNLSELASSRQRTVDRATAAQEARHLAERADEQARAAWTTRLQADAREERARVEIAEVQRRKVQTAEKHERTLARAVVEASQVELARADLDAAERAWLEAHEHGVHVGSEVDEALASEADEEQRWANSRAEHDRQRAAVSEARERGWQWSSALEGAWEDRLRAAQTRAAASLDAADLGASRAFARDLGSWDEAARSRLAEREAEASAARSRLEADHANARGTRAVALDRMEAAGQALARLRKDLNEARADLDRSRRGRSAPKETVARLRELGLDDTATIDLVPADERASVVRRMGDRAAAPRVTSVGDLRRIAAAASDGAIQVVYWPPGQPLPGAGVLEAPDLEAALALGPGRTVIGPGFRLDPDGLVVFGEADRLSGALADEAAAEGRIVALVAELASAVEAYPIAEAERASAEAAVEAARVAEAAENHRHVVEVATLRQTTRSERARYEQDRQAAIRLASSTEHGRREAELSALRSERDAVLSSTRAAVEAVIAACPVEEPKEAGAALLRARQTVEAARRVRQDATRVELERARLRTEAQGALQSKITVAAQVQEQLRETEAQLLTFDDDLTKAGERLQAAQTATQLDRERERAALEQLARARAEVEQRESVARAAEQATTALQVVQGALAEREVATLAALEQARRRSTECAARVEDLASRSARLLEARDLAGAAIATAEAQVVELGVQRAATAEVVGRDRARVLQLREGVRESERLLAAVRTRAAQAQRECETVTEQLGATQAELEVLRRRAEDRYQLSLAGLLDRLVARRELHLEVDADVQEGLSLGGEEVPGVLPRVIRPEDLLAERAILEAVARVEENRVALQSLGEVSLGALDEFRQTRVRYGEIEAQRADLEESVQGIRTAIAKLNRVCREQFRETFDQVNENFQQVYPRLVGGGSARLSLTNEEDLLETGVEIFVQPPGKRLQNLQLLSGGEKAMTAIALLIALFRVKPSPFCVLDEVDAPLDEANGARFNDMLREMSTRSQFLVITHNRKTMECADTLYGVTMSRPGVSLLVSVDLAAW